MSIRDIAKELPAFEYIRSIPGIGDNLTSRILAEFGSINKFNNANQIVAYADIDSQIYQSGKVSGNYLKISKKGNKNLRCLLFLAVTCMIKQSIKSNIVDFYKKKKHILFNTN